MPLYSNTLYCQEPSLYSQGIDERGLNRTQIFQEKLDQLENGINIERYYHLFDEYIEYSKTGQVIKSVDFLDETYGKIYINNKETNFIDSYRYYFIITKNMWNNICDICQNIKEIWWNPCTKNRPGDYDVRIHWKRGSNSWGSQLKWWIVHWGKCLFNDTNKGIDARGDDLMLQSLRGYFPFGKKAYSNSESSSYDDLIFDDITGIETHGSTNYKKTDFIFSSNNFESTYYGYPDGNIENRSSEIFVQFLLCAYTRTVCKWGRGMPIYVTENGFSEFKRNNSYDNIMHSGANDFYLPIDITEVAINDFTFTGETNASGRVVVGTVGAYVPILKNLKITKLEIKYTKQIIIAILLVITLIIIITKKN